jgi:FKBP-type peptidyl-prolyl cis-trans isomerase
MMSGPSTEANRPEAVTILRIRSLTALALLGVTAALAGCGGDDSSTTAQTTQTQTSPTTPTQTTQERGTPKAKRVKPGPGEGDLDRKPKVPKGKGSPPSKLVAQDLVVGKGRRANSGSTVSVQYVGVLFDNGKEFDASWKGKRPGQPFEFALGAGQVIPGWDEGIAGMRVGGRRKLIIPSDLAYGPQGFLPTSRRTRR